MSISAMKQALNLLETSWGNGHEDTLKYWNETAHFLRQAIAEAEDAVAAEREACAMVAEEMERIRFDSVGDPRIRVFESQIAKAIRARGEK